MLGTKFGRFAMVFLVACASPGAPQVAAPVAPPEAREVHQAPFDGGAPATETPKASSPLKGPCLSEAQIVDVIREHMGEIKKACWDHNLSPKPEVNVKVSLKS